MSNESKIGLGPLGLVGLCCAGPLIVSVLVSEAVLGGLSALVADHRWLLLASGALLLMFGAWLLAQSSRHATHARLIRPD